MSAVPFGFWIRGGKDALRVLVDATRAFAGFAACDEAAAIDGEHYLSAFGYGADFRDYLTITGSTRGFDGFCGAAWIWLDIDREDDIDSALADTRALCLHLTDEWRVAADDLLMFLSGGEGFHIGVPTSLWTPEPSATFNAVARRFAFAIAAKAGGVGVAIDIGVYDKVRLFRAPNSRHPRTGLRKRLLTIDELRHFNVERIADLARSPRPFDVPATAVHNGLLAGARTVATADVAAEAEAMRKRRGEIAAKGGPSRLNSLTLEFIRDSAPKGGAGAADDAGRHRRLYAAARNLGEFACPTPLAHALLTEAGLDCGITPSEVVRHIANGLRDAAGKEPANG